VNALLSEGARKILRYLHRNPRAQDTLEGVLHWWLLDLHIEEQEREVETALRELMAAGLVLSQQGQDRELHYRLNPAQADRIRRMLGCPPAEVADA